MSVDSTAPMAILSVVTASAASSVFPTAPAVISRFTLVNAASVPPVTVRSAEMMSPSPVKDATSTSRAPVAKFCVSPVPATLTSILSAVMASSTISSVSIASFAIFKFVIASFAISSASTSPFKILSVVTASAPSSKFVIPPTLTSNTKGFASVPKPVRTKVPSAASLTSFPTTPSISVTVKPVSSINTHSAPFHCKSSPVAVPSANLSKDTVASCN